MKITKEMRREIYCVKHGHSRVVTLCFGYVYCGRCDAQIGDIFGSMFNLEDKVIYGHPNSCVKCKKAKKALSKADINVLERLRKEKQK